jgi:hypothetical protein
MIKGKKVSKKKTQSKVKTVEKVSFNELEQRYIEQRRKSKAIRDKQDKILLKDMVDRQKDIYYYQQKLRPLESDHERTMRGFYRTDDIQLKEKRFKRIKSLQKDINKWKDKVRKAESDMEIMRQAADNLQLQLQLI